jgi:hypothetical protein
MGQEELLQLRQIDIRQGQSDSYEVAFAAGAAYGDPIERDPEAVRHDVENGGISHAAARDIFRVALLGDEDDLTVDERATDALRRQAIVERLGREPGTPGRRHPVLKRVTEYLDLMAADNGKHVACARCGHTLCTATAPDSSRWVKNACAVLSGIALMP